MKQIPKHVLTAVCTLLQPYFPELTPVDLVARLQRPEEPLQAGATGATTRAGLSVNEVAESLGVTPQHIYNLIRRNVIPKAKLGARTLIPAEYVRGLLSGRGPVTRRA